MLLGNVVPDIVGEGFRIMQFVEDTDPSLCFRIGSRLVVVVAGLLGPQMFDDMDM